MKNTKPDSIKYLEKLDIPTPTGHFYAPNKCADNDQNGAQVLLESPVNSALIEPLVTSDNCRKEQSKASTEPEQSCGTQCAPTLRRRGNRPARPAYVIDANGCWLWQGAISHRGYGLAWDAAAYKMRAAHILIYEQHRGAVPAGLQLDHLCRNRKCVNPAHLDPVTQDVNVQRGAA